MNDFVFYCSKCKKSFAGEGYEINDNPLCPSCGHETKSTGAIKDE